MRLLNQFKAPDYLDRGCPVLSDTHRRAHSPQTFVFVSVRVHVKDEGW